MSEVHIVGIAGGSCSGKTSFSKQVVQSLGAESSDILFQDNYYIDQSSKFDKDGGAVNFDHPEAIDFDLLKNHLQRLKQGLPIDVPIYDFVTHTRKLETLEFLPKNIVVLDGTLIFTRSDLLKEMSLSIFINCSKEIRFNRRLERDVKERGRTPEGVKAQFDEHVEPMHIEFVEPSKQGADIVASQQQYSENSSGLLERIKGLLDLDS